MCKDDEKRFRAKQTTMKRKSLQKLNGNLNYLSVIIQ